MTIIEPGVDQIPSWLIYVDLWCAHKMYEHGRSCLLSGGDIRCHHGGPLIC